jgi:hypothetical protein
MRGSSLRTLTIVFLCGAGMSSVSSIVHAQVEARQVFTVRIPTKLSVTTPSPTVTVVHDGTALSQVSTTQRWSVRSNARSGATVSFSTDRAFAHMTNPGYKRDARLDLVIPPSQSPANWTVTVGSDHTNYRGAVPDERATVRAVSNRPGAGAFDVTVTFLEDPHEPLEQGEYVLTVVGTITEN